MEAFVTFDTSLRNTLLAESPGLSTVQRETNKRKYDHSVAQKQIKKKLHIEKNRQESKRCQLDRYKCKSNDIMTRHNKRLESLETMSNEYIEYTLDSARIIGRYLELTTQDTDEESASDISCQIKEVVEQYNKMFDHDECTSAAPVVSCAEDSDKSVCPTCNEYYEFEEGFLVCYKCGKTTTGLHVSDEATFKELQDYTYKPHFSYDRKTHFDDWLSRLEATEHRDLPDIVVESVIEEARKEGVKDMSTLTEDRVRVYLKRLNYNEYYSNVIRIINKINGRDSIKVSQETREKLNYMFEQVKRVYELY